MAFLLDAQVSQSKRLVIGEGELLGLLQRQPADGCGPRNRGGGCWCFLGRECWRLRSQWEKREDRRQKHHALPGSCECHEFLFGQKKPLPDVKINSPLCISPKRE